MEHIRILIPAYLEPEYLELCLRSIYQETVTDRWSVAVYDDSGAQVNLATVKRYEDRYPNIYYVDGGPSGSTGIGNALNRLVQASKWSKNNRELVFFIVNDDNVFPDGWYSQLAVAARRCSQSAEVVSVNQIEPKPSIFDATLIYDLGKRVEDFDLDEFNRLEGTIHSDRVEFDEKGSTFPFLITKQDFLKVGGFDVYYPSSHVVDLDFFYKLHLTGCRLVRFYGLHLYHFVSKGTKDNEKVNRVDIERRENLAHYFFNNKWGFFPRRGPDYLVQ